MRRHRFSWCLAIIPALLSAGPVLAQTPPEVARILETAAEREQDIPHEGTVVTTIGGRGPGETHSFARRIYAGHAGCEVSEQVDPGLLADQRAVCDGSRRWRILHSGSVVLVSAPFNFEDLRRERVERVRGGARRFTARLLGDQVLAGRSAWTIEISRTGREGSRRMRALAVDKETYLQLGNVTYGRDGEEMSRTIYRDITYLSDEEIDPERFRFVPPADALVLPEPNRIELPVLFRDAHARADWIAPLRSRPREWRPEGVALPEFGEGMVAQFFYVDERDRGRPHPVFLFEHPRGQRRGYFDDFYGTKDVGREPRQNGQSVSWMDEALIYVLTSALPVEDLLSAARNHLRPPR
jgi:hypothetical protein